MSIVLVEGFEAFVNETPYSLDLMERFMQNLPVKVPGWFSDAGFAKITSAETRIEGGQSLHFSRSATAVGAWDNAVSARIGWGFTNKQRMTVGFGLKIDNRPDSSFPILQLCNDVGLGEEEQVSVWLSPEGKLFCSSTDAQELVINQLPPAIIPEAASPAGLFRYGRWNYVEVFVDYTGAVPKVSFQMNGTLVLDAAEAAALEKLGSNQLSSVFFINPPNTYWSNTAFNQFIDDVYIAGNENGFRHPQQIILMGTGNMVQNQWGGGGALATGRFDPVGYTPGGGVKPSANNQVNLYEMGDLPASIAQLNALSVTCTGTAGSIGNVELTDRVEFGFQRSSGNTSRNGKIVMYEGTLFTFRHIITNVPGSVPNELTKANVDPLLLYVRELGFL